jgi:hypothetical protein
MFLAPALCVRTSLIKPGRSVVAKARQGLLCFYSFFSDFFIQPLTRGRPISACLLQTGDSGRSQFMILIM